jgi:mitochondrial import receptor subunit TOM40
MFGPPKDKYSGEKVVKYEELSKEAKSISLANDTFSGFHFEFMKVLNNFQLVHNFALASKDPGYTLMTTYHKPSFYLVGKASTEGIFGRYAYTSPFFSFLLIGQSSKEEHQSAIAIEGEYKFLQSLFQLRWVSTGTYHISYMKRIPNPWTNLSLGCELYYNHKQGTTMTTFGGRWLFGKWILTGMTTFDKNLNLTATRKVSDRLSVTTEYIQQSTQNAVESSWLAGYEYKLTRSTVKGQIDSNWKVAGYYEDLINDFVKFKLSAELDHKKKEYSFGFGLTLAS